MRPSELLQSLWEILSPGRRGQRQALWLALGYFILGSAWIVFSDQAVAVMFHGRERAIVAASMAKGWLFVASTSGLIYLMARWVQHTLRRSREDLLLYRELAVSADLGLVVEDLDGRVMVWNPAAERLLGWSAGEVLGHGLSGQLSPDLLEERQDLVRRVRKGESLRELETHWPTRDARLVEVSLTLFPVLDARGATRGVGTLMRDIGERKRAEQLAQAQRERLGVTLAALGEGVVGLDAQGRIESFNPAAAEISGVGPAEALGRPVAEVLRFAPHAGRVGICADPLRAAALSQRSVECEPPCRVTDRQGREHLVLFTASPLFDRKGRPDGAVLVLRDITLRQRMERELAKATKLEAMGLLAGGIAHDFNNYLTSILGNLSMAREKAAVAGDPEAAQWLDEAESACGRARGLTRQLLGLAREGKPLSQAVQLAGLVRESAMFAARGSACRIEFSAPRSLPAVLADEVQVGQVVHNLVLNALQAMPAGGTIQVGVDLAPEPHEPGVPLPPGRYLKVTVQDQGPGIPEAVLPRIFDPFFTTKDKGSGLGLTTSWSILKAHGGYLAVHAPAGQGACFSFYLPAAPALAESAAPPSAAAPPPPAGSGRVLVMDDDPAIRNLFGNILKRYGYQADFASDGTTAVERYTEARAEGRPYDVVLMDLTIPGGMGGREALNLLKGKNPKVKAIVCSGYSQDGGGEDPLAMGFQARIAKPFRIEEFIRVLQTVIGGAASL